MPLGRAVALWLPGMEEEECKGVTGVAQPLRAFSGETAEFTISTYLFWALDGNNYYLRQKWNGLGVDRKMNFQMSCSLKDRTGKF